MKKPLMKEKQYSIFLKTSIVKIVSLNEFLVIVGYGFKVDEVKNPTL